MSKLLVETYRNDLQKMGLTEDLIQLCLAERFPEKFSRDEVIQDILEENQLIYEAMVEKGFQPFHENIIAIESIDGETGEADEEATQSQSEETANPETEPNPKSQTDCQYPDR